MKRLLAALALLPAAVAPAAEPTADLIVRNGKVLTVDAKFSVAEAVAVRGDRVVAVGKDADVMRLAGPATRVVDAGGNSVLPGLMDSHAHPVGAALSEAKQPLPRLKSIADVLEHVRTRAAALPAGEWVVVRYAFPTRLAENRFPTKAELDAAAPKHPVLYHAGPAGVVNSAALKASGVTRDTADPPNGKVVRDPATGEPTGLLRNAYGVLKGVPKSDGEVDADGRRTAVRKLFRLYNEHGITSVADRNASGGDLALYRDLRDRGELTLRVNVARSFDPYGNRETVGKRLDALTGPAGKDGPTGAGDEWVRIGPIKFFVDGGMLNGTAYMHKPWPKGPAYQVAEDDYRGLRAARWLTRLLTTTVSAAETSVSDNSITVRVRFPLRR
jgi:predicted amidohydrolase YtcJ